MRSDVVSRYVLYVKMQHPLIETYRGQYREDMLDYLRRFRLSQYGDISDEDISKMLARWYMTQLDDEDSDDTLHTPYDPFFPYASYKVDKGLSWYLGDMQVPPERIKEIHEGLVDMSRAAIDDLLMLQRYLDEYSVYVRKTKTGNDVVLTLVTQPIGAMMTGELPDLVTERYNRMNRSYLGPHDNDKTLIIPNTVYEALVDSIEDELSARLSKRPGHDSSTTPGALADLPPPPPITDELIYSMIKRYQTLGWDRYQEEPNSAIMDVLVDKLGINHEAMVSPISRYPGLPYSSMYLDIDRYFGSTGPSYYLLEDTMIDEERIAIQAHPPDDEAILDGFIDYIIEWLEREDRPMTVALMYPSDLLTPGIEKAEEGEHRIFRRMSNDDNTLIILQNAAGKIQEAVDTEAIHDIIDGL